MFKTTSSLVTAGLLLGALAGCVGSAGPEAGAPAQPTAAPAAPPAQPVAAAPEPPKTMAECRALAVKSAAPSPAAQAPATAAQAPSPGAQATIETQRRFDEKLDALHETFRCCYDVLYAPSAPKKDGHIALMVKVDHTGKLTSAEILAQDTDVASPEVHACILETARSVEYPKPTMDMDVGYQRVFDFKARR